jgi:uncharacterized delta-60 repeat protein
MAAVNSAPRFVNFGKLITDLGDYDTGYSIAIQADGKILVAGWSGGNFALARYNPDGSLDTTFSGDGKVTTNFGFSAQGYSVAVQGDGRILVAGQSGGNFALARYNPDGSLDTTFDGDGQLTTDFGYSDYGYSVAVQTDGKILMAGYSGSYPFSYDFALARYNADGSLDTTFSGDGKVTTDFGAGVDDQGYSTALQADGKILVAGYSGNYPNQDFALVRYNSDGSLDTTFSGDGKVTTDFGSSSDIVRSIVVQANGKILVAGYSGTPFDYNFALARYNPNGSLDTTFSGDGKVTTDFGGNDAGFSVTLQADGKILVAGASTINGNSDFALARYNPDGSLDTSFSDDGKVTTAIGSGYDYGYSVTVQADGKILIVGESSNSDYDFALARYNPDGSLDTSFETIDSSISAASYTEGDSPVALDSDVHIRDVELDMLNGGLGNYSGATLTLARHDGPNAEDLFSPTGTLGALTEGNPFDIGGTVIGTVTQNSGGTLTLLFNDNATAALVDEALQQIAYSNSSDAPPFSVQIDWTFSDGNTGAQGTGGALSATRATVVNIIPTNDAPTAVNNTVTTPEDTAYVFTASDFGFSDIDGDSLVEITVTTLPTAGSLTLYGMELTATDQVVWAPDLDAGQLVFTPAPNANGASYASFGFQVSDGMALSDNYTLTVDVTAVRDDLTLTGTVGNDTLTGDLIDAGSYDTLSGLDGDDVLKGLVGNDTLLGGNGHDRLYGGTDADTLAGGIGNDIYGVDNPGDTVTEYAGAGSDTVQSAVSYTLAANVENLALTGTAALNGAGNGLANTLQGNGAANRLNGGAGADILKGWAGNDTLNGGAGADTLHGGAGNDIFVFNSKAGADTVADFMSGTDKLKFSQAALPVGDSDTVLEDAMSLAGSGGFTVGAELVIATQNIGGGITATSAAAAIGSASAAYAAGAHALFAVDNGSQSAVYYFTAANANAAVEANELLLVATLSATAGTVLADYGLTA